MAFFLLLGLTPLIANASYKDSFPAQSGFTHAPLAADDPGTGKQLSGGVVRRGSPTIAEIDGNTANGKEIAIGGNDGQLYVYRSNGSLAWSHNVMPSSCSYSAAAGDGLIQTAPSVGNLFGGSTPYVVVGYGTLLETNCDGGVVVYNGATGAQLWRFSLRAWQASQGYKPERLYGVVTTPALADTDFDGKMEIGFGGLDRYVYLLNADGSVRWYYHAADTVQSSPAFANIDTDPELEMIFGTDITGNSRLEPATINGGLVYAFDTQPRAPKRIEFNTGYIWQSANWGQTIWSSPTITDLDGDGVKEVIIGSGCFFSPEVTGHWIKILDSHNGAEIRTLNATGCVTSTPAVGDIDGDGKLEIVATVNGARNNPATPAYVEAWEYNSPTPKWKIDPRNSNGNFNDGNLDVASPVLADLDGNGSLEVIVTNFSDVSVFRGDNGAQLTCRNCGLGPTKSLFTFYTLQGTPAVGDIDGDGDLEVVIGGGNRQAGSGPGYLYVWTNFAGQLGSPTGNQPHYSAPWPMFHGNAAHTGVFIPPALRPSTAELVLFRLIQDWFLVALQSIAPPASSVRSSVNVRAGPPGSTISAALAELARSAGTAKTPVWRGSLPWNIGQGAL